MAEKQVARHSAPDSELTGRPAATRSTGLFQKLFGIREALMVVIILVTIAILTLLSPHFLAGPISWRFHAAWRWKGWWSSG